MDAARWQRIEALYHAVAELREDERLPYLMRHYQGDDDIRREVEVLLQQSDSSLQINFPASSSDVLPSGHVLGHYRIDSLLGAGGMGRVYSARDSRLGRSVAIKVVREEFAERFKREASAISALNHPNVCTLYDVGPNFLVMELVKGETLSALLERGRVPVRQALNYASQIAGALAAAHERGIIHRDLKPDNVMLVKEHHVKLLDFGLAKLQVASVAPGDSTLTEAASTEVGTIVGTVAYMSPEQAQGQKVDSRSDVFAFGSVLYEMLTGRSAFRSDNKLSTLSAILREDPQPLRNVAPEVPVELDTLVARCLRKDPESRWQHMADVRVMLEELRQRQDTAPPLLHSPSARWHRVIWPAVALAATVAIWSYWPRTSPVIQDPITVTSYPGVEREPALSPDGKQIAFVSNDGGTNFDVYVTLVGTTGRPLRLTQDPAVDYAPVWSPDGSQIAFGRSNSVYLVSALGGAERKLIDLTGPKRWTQLTGTAALRPVSLAWSPDGKLLAVTDGSSEQSAPRATLVDVATREKRFLTTSSPSHYGDFQYAISPDGSRLAFVRYRTADLGDLYVTGIIGGESVQLTSGVSITSVVWSPWSDEVYYSSNRALYRLKARRGETPQQVIGTGAGIGNFTIAASGRLVFDRGLVHGGLWEQTSDETAPRRVSATTRSEGWPQYSRDGSRIAFVSFRRGAQEIWVSDRSGRNATPLTSPGNIPGGPRWSPDGRLVVFSGWDEAKTNRDVYVVSADGGIPRRLTTSPVEEGRPNFSRDGNWIYFFSHRSGRSEIWKMPAAGGDGVQVTRTGGHEARESMDGLTLYFTALAVPGLKSVPVGGGEEKEILPDVRTGAWDINRYGVAYLGDKNQTGGRPVLLWNPANGRVKQVLEVRGQINSNGTRVFAAAEDGTAYLWAQREQAEIDLFMIESIRPSGGS